MAGNKIGAQKAKANILKKYGADYYQKIGALGGKNGTGGGFGQGEEGRERARIYGKLGGQKSKRRPAKLTDEIF